MNKIFLVSVLSVAVAVLPGISSYAGGAHVANDWTGAYVPAQLQRNNVTSANHVASSWADAYVPQQLHHQCNYQGGYVATNWADAYVVQKIRNSNSSNLLNTGT